MNVNVDSAYPSLQAIHGRIIYTPDGLSKLLAASVIQAGAHCAEAWKMAIDKLQAIQKTIGYK